MSGERLWQKTVGSVISSCERRDFAIRYKVRHDDFAKAMSDMSTLVSRP